MAKAPDLSWHAKKRLSGHYQEWQCKYCKRSFRTVWDGNRGIRQHLRRVHKREYARVPAALYFIEE